MQTQTSQLNWTEQTEQRDRQTQTQTETQIASKTASHNTYKSPSSSAWRNAFWEHSMRSTVLSFTWQSADAAAADDDDDDDVDASNTHRHTQWMSIHTSLPL